MGKEIERKFLVHPEALADLLSQATHITQGYLSYIPEVRVRTKISPNGSKTAFMTVKGKGTISRSEYEYEVPSKDAETLLRLCDGEPIIKDRFKVGQWEVDQFHGALDGLWLAEIELSSEDEHVEIPSWVRREVTGNKLYSNSNLTRYGIPVDYLTR